VCCKCWCVLLDLVTLSVPNSIEPHYFRRTLQLSSCLRNRLMRWNIHIPSSPPQGSSSDDSSTRHMIGLYRAYTKEWFQKLTRNLFLTLHGHNVHRQQQQLSKFLMRYQLFASHAYCGASFQDGVAAGKDFLCAPF